MRVVTSKDQGLYNKPSAAVHPGALAAGRPYQNTIQYNAICWVFPVVLRGSTNWTIKARDARRKRAAEMKYMTKTAGHTWTDYKTNTKELI